MARILNAKKEVVAVMPLDQVDYYFDEQGIVDRAGYDVVLDDDELAAQKSTRKLDGIEFEEVMCSATADDQHGLNAVWTQYALAKMQQQPMPPVYFHFANSNKLLLTEDNIEAFKAVWLPFRMSFFPVSDTA